MRRQVLLAWPLALAVGVSACATKKFVRNSVGEVNAKADSLSRSLEETQERTRQNETRITEVDQRAQQAGQAAVAAQSTADRASSSATAAATTATDASARAEALDKASKRLVYEVVISEDQGNFKAGSRTLPPEATTSLDDLIARLTSDPKAAFFEIEGHTDSSGDPQTNLRLGEQRAEAVKRYLYEKHKIPLHKMNIISYGETKPEADNRTRQGRAQNRRVVVRVVS